MDAEDQICLILLQSIDLPEEQSSLLLSPEFTAFYRNKEELFKALTHHVNPSGREEIETSLRDEGFASFPISFKGDTASDQNEQASTLLGHPVQIGPGYIVPGKTFAAQLAQK